MSEHDLQRALVEHIEARGVPGLVYTAIPMGGLRDKVTAVRLKAEGVRPGFPDLWFRVPGNPAFWLELKTTTGRLSDEQKVVHAALRAAGEQVCVAWGLDAAIALLEERGALRRSVAAPRQTPNFEAAAGVASNPLYGDAGQDGGSTGRCRASESLLISEKTNVKRRCRCGGEHPADRRAAVPDVVAELRRMGFGVKSGRARVTGGRKR